MRIPGPFSFSNTKFFFLCISTCEKNAAAISPRPAVSRTDETLTGSKMPILPLDRQLNISLTYSIQKKRANGLMDTWILLKFDLFGL